MRGKMPNGHGKILSVSTKRRAAPRPRRDRAAAARMQQLSITETKNTRVSSHIFLWNGCVEITSQIRELLNLKLSEALVSQVLASSL